MHDLTTISSSAEVYEKDRNTTFCWSCKKKSVPLPVLLNSRVYSWTCMGLRLNTSLTELDNDSRYGIRLTPQSHSNSKLMNLSNMLVDLTLVGPMRRSVRIEMMQHSKIITLVIF